jgi:hypothetical protein
VEFLEAQNVQIKVLQQKVEFLETQYQQSQDFNSNTQFPGKRSQDVDHKIEPLSQKSQSSQLQYTTQTISSPLEIRLVDSNGILSFLQSQGDHLFEITCSSVYDKILKPENVLTKDDKVWWSKSKTNEWICFHFINNSVLLESYLLRTDFEDDSFCGDGIENWTVHGSIDSLNWETIDNRNELLHYGDSSNHIYSCQSNQFYKFIKFTFNAADGYRVTMNQIELSG